jgi:3-dehydrotetronate 4-kinase
MLLGCIGDDFTGSSDLANTLARNGMRVQQFTGVPGRPAPPGVEAGVVALKTRSVAPDQAVLQSLAALDWLRAQGCQQFFFKYCSTFDSTPQGNIGPVADALAEALGADCVIVCPAFPGAGRTLYQGHLFVGDRLLNESGMQSHPLTPMTDPDICRWLRQQSRHRVGLIPAPTVMAGPAAIREALLAQEKAGNRHVVVDAIRDEDLRAIGAASEGLPLITGGSGVAQGLPDNFRRRGLSVLADSGWSGQGGKCVVLSGSCSVTTRGQIARHRSDNPAREIVAADVIEGRTHPAEVADWLMAAGGLPLAYSSADPDAVYAVQERFGRNRAAAALEGFFAAVAKNVVDRGVERLVVAGGETSGAVVEGLSIAALDIGPEIAAGVPALRAGDRLVMALKSGNFGAPGFFDRAARVLKGLP